ncbi:MAG: LacI family transcriptional regulator [Lentisphaerae bacterium]|nr:LacI family transcriptional regulator [Lentisphaerota bacterium]
MISLKDIAAELNISISVVSRVLNPVPDANARISEATRKKVLETASRLGYRRNRAAEFMKRNRLGVIGVFIPDIADALIANLLFGIAAKAEMLDFPLEIHPGLCESSYTEFMRRHCAQAASGIISYSTAQYHHPEIGSLLDEYCGNGGKLLILNDVTCEKYTTVAMDEVKGGALAAEMLAENPCREYCFVNDSKSQDANQLLPRRGQGFFQYMDSKALNARQISADEELVSLLRASVPAAPVGFFAGYDMLAMKIINQAGAMGKIAGRDFKLVGYDDLPVAGAIKPGLSTIGQPFREEGMLAVEKLVRMIYGSVEKNELLVPYKVKRETA